MRPRPSPADLPLARLLVISIKQQMPNVLYTVMQASLRFDDVAGAVGKLVESLSYLLPHMQEPEEEQQDPEVADI